MRDAIVVENARVHNLKGVSLSIPRDRLVVFSGVSGSGKSSLVFDTLHAESQRQLVETFGTFARKFLPRLPRPEVDGFRNLSTSIVIDQKRLGRTLRSTVGTATEVYTYLRMLFSRCGDAPAALSSSAFSFNHPEGMCPACVGLGKRITVDVDRLLDRDRTLREGAITHPDWKVGGWNWRELVAAGLFDVDRPVRDLPPDDLERLLHSPPVPMQRGHGAGTYAKNWEGVARRLERLATDKAEVEDDEDDAYARYLAWRDCPTCGGLRLNDRALSVRVQGRGLAELVGLELADLDRWLATVAGPVAAPLVRKMRSILGHLVGIGVGYLSLHRAVATLSGGESQRLKLARQLDCDLVGMMYVLDEPTVGLHPRDTDQLLGMLRRLRDQGNSVLVVEHDPAVIAAADHVVELGPGPGRHGGEVVFAGSRDAFLASEALTARLMRGGTRDSTARRRRAPTGAWAIRGARVHNLQGVDVDVPRGVLVAVTGVAGSGKSTLVHEVLVPMVPEAVVVDQRAIGRSSRSTPATWIGVFDAIRKLFARATGRPASLFSFNSAGACPTCKGHGAVAVEMSFLDDVRVECADCRGRRYTDEVLALTWGGRSTHDVLSLTAAEAREVFEQREIRPALDLLCSVGLDYLALGQPVSTLSGGECQRLKLARELGRSGNLYVLDEPTTGLHLADVARLVRILERLVDDGNSVVVIEHNLDVVAHADHVIDLGPEGGRAGGQVVATGTPEAVARVAASQTGRYLAAHLP